MAVFAVGHPEVVTRREEREAAGKLPTEGIHTIMALDLPAPKHDVTAQRLAHIGGPSELTLPPDRRFAKTDAPGARWASTAITEILIVDAADRHDAEEGYSWRWEVIYGDAHRSGACRTRAQAEREAAIVLALLKGR